MDFTPTPILTPGMPADARTRILDAAETLVRARGVAGLTLEAAAKLAGISKGGLLYHFASKEALLTGLLARMAEFIAADFDAGVAAQPPGPGQVARAMLTWGFGLTPDAMNERCDRAAAVFLAAFHHDPALLDPVRAVVARMRAAVSGGRPAAGPWRGHHGGRGRTVHGPHLRHVRPGARGIAADARRPVAAAAGGGPAAAAGGGA